MKNKNKIYIMYIVKGDNGVIFNYRCAISEYEKFIKKAKKHNIDIEAQQIGGGMSMDGGGSSIVVRIHKNPKNLDKSDYSTWNPNEYDDGQWNIVKQARDLDNKRYGNVDDFDPKKFSDAVLEVISLSRGDDEDYGSIANIEDTIKVSDNISVQQLRVISRGRGHWDGYGNVDHLGMSIKGDQMEAISKGRGDGDVLGNIDDLNPKKYNADQMKYVSYGRGKGSTYGCIDDLNPKKVKAEEMKSISLKRGQVYEND